VREVNGKSADTLVADLSNPTAGETVTLERFMGREMRTRYLNPKWIEAMLKEGYAGGRMIRQITDNLWGWQVAVPDAVDATKWQEMFETYVQDRYGLGIREKLRAAENLAAYKAMVERMLTVVDKGYWTPAPETVAQLRRTQSDLVPSVAAENQRTTGRAALQPAPGPALTVSATASAPLASKTPPVVTGRVLEEKTPRTSEAPSTKVDWPQVLVAGLASLTLIGFGWWRAGQSYRG